MLKPLMYLHLLNLWDFIEDISLKLFNPIAIHIPAVAEPLSMVYLTSMIQSVYHM